MFLIESRDKHVGLDSECLYRHVISWRRGEREFWPGLWSEWGPAPGVSVLWPILQSKLSSGSWESWHFSSHWVSSMLKLQAPGEPAMWSARQKLQGVSVKSCFSAREIRKQFTSCGEGNLFPISCSPQSVSSDWSAQSALLSHTRWDSMQSPL